MKRLYPAVYALIFFCLGFTTCSSEGKNTDARFVVANGRDTRITDPLTLFGEPLKRVASAVFEGLVSTHPVTGRPVPGIAESWSVLPGGKEFLFSLRQSEWSDGVPITAATFVDSWERISKAQPASVNTGIVKEIIASAEAVDQYSLKLFSNAGPVAVLNALADPVFAPVPLHVLKLHGSEWTSIDFFVGNGAFLPAEFVESEKLALAPNPRYWDAEHIELINVVFLCVEDPGQSLFDNGSVDWLPSGPSTLSAAGLEDLIQYPYSAVSFCRFNLLGPPFDNLEARRLFAAMLARESLLDNIPGNGRLPAPGLIPDADEGVRRPLFAIPPADSPPLEINYLYSASVTNRYISGEILKVVQDSAFFTLHPGELSWQKYLIADKSDFHLIEDMMMFMWGDPLDVLASFVSDAPGNRGGYSNEEFDAVIRKARFLEQSPEREALLQKAEKMIIEEDVAAIPIYFPASANRIDLGKWAGWYPNYRDRHPLKYLRRRK